MNYQDFQRAWHEALRASGLPVIGRGKETMCLSSLDRVYQVWVEPLGGQDAAPFHVTAELSWTWDALKVARSATIEESVLVELLAQEDAECVDTDPPWLRVDIVLRASAPYEKPISMPTPAAWAAWTKETMHRLEHIEALLPAETVRETEGGLLEVFAWKGEPQVTCQCEIGGELKLVKVELGAWDSVTLPRQWDDPDREPDSLPDAQLADLLGRVKASLYAWMQALDHLRRS